MEVHAPPDTAADRGQSHVDSLIDRQAASIAHKAYLFRHRWNACTIRYGFHREMREPRLTVHAELTTTNLPRHRVMAMLVLECDSSLARN
jgi:hypothetical protein